MILKVMLSALLVTATAMVSAQDRFTENESEYYPWRVVTLDMSSGDYRKACRENRRFLRHVIKSQTTAALVSLQVPESGIRMLGAVAALAIEQDARLHLNQSRTLALEFADLADEDRALQIGYKFKW